MKITVKIPDFLKCFFEPESPKVVIKDITEPKLKLSKIIGDEVYDTEVDYKLCDIQYNHEVRGKDLNTYTTNTFSMPEGWVFRLKSLWAHNNDLFYVAQFEKENFDNVPFIMQANRKEGVLSVLYKQVKDANIALYVRQTFVDNMIDDKKIKIEDDVVSFTATFSEGDEEYETAKKAYELFDSGNDEEAKKLLDKFVIVVKKEEESQ